MPSTATDVRTLTARGLTLHSARGDVFAPVDLELPPATPAAVLGAQGSGRSALLLALTGRMQGVTGERLTLGRIDGLRHPHRLRRATAVARLGGLVELEDALTVAETVDEHALLEGLSRRRGRARFAALAATTGVSLDPDVRLESLPAEDRTVLALLAACLRPSALVALDDVDSSLTVPQLERVLGVIETLGERGHRVAVSALASSPVPRGAVVVELPTLGHGESAPATLPDRPRLED